MPTRNDKRRSFADGSQAQNAGFTLIEIMAALAILSGALLVLLDAHYAALSLYSDTRDEVLMQGLMEQAMGQAELEAMAGKANGSGDFGAGYEGFSYNFTSTVMSQDKNAVPLYTVNVSVAGPGDTRNMTMLVYNIR